MDRGSSIGSNSVNGPRRLLRGGPGRPAGRQDEDQMIWVQKISVGQEVTPRAIGSALPVIGKTPPKVVHRKGSVVIRRENGGIFEILTVQGQAELIKLCQVQTIPSLRINDNIQCNVLMGGIIKAYGEELGFLIKAWGTRGAWQVNGTIMKTVEIVGQGDNPRKSEEMGENSGQRQIGLHEETMVLFGAGTDTEKEHGQGNQDQ